LFLAAAGACKIIWSEYIAEELSRKMEEIGWSHTSSEALVNALIELAEMVDYRQIEGGNFEDWLRDPDDHPIMATAIIGKADFLVTWNTKDFPPKRRFADITIITPDTFIHNIS
jgi:predicted nucleic acid-binding protein